jgi:hypothetical protein
MTHEFDEALEKDRKHKAQAEKRRKQEADKLADTLRVAALDDVIKAGDNLRKVLFLSGISTYEEKSAAINAWDTAVRTSKNIIF